MTFGSRCIPDLQKCGLGDRYASEAGADTERVVVNLDGLGSGTNNQMLPIHPENGSAPFWVYDWTCRLRCHRNKKKRRLEKRDNHEKF